MGFFIFFRQTSELKEALPHSYMDCGSNEHHRAGFVPLEELPVAQMMGKLFIITESRRSSQY
jgi:hypothetical protein